MSDHAPSEPIGHSQELRHPDEGGHAAPPRPRARRLDDFHLDAEVIAALTGRDRTRLRRLTPIRGAVEETYDPVVLKALAEVRALYRDDLDGVRKTLAERYLNVTEAVTARLNRGALPRTTRLLLSTEGVYEHLLLRSLHEGVGQASGASGEAEHAHGGETSVVDSVAGEYQRATLAAEESGDGQ